MACMKRGRGDYGHSGKLQRLADYKATRLYKIIQKLIQVAYGCPKTMQKTAKNFVELLRQGARMWDGMFNFGHMFKFSHK